VCKWCAVAKALQKKVPQETQAKTLQGNNHRVYLNMSLIKFIMPKSVTSKPNWLMIVDDKTQLKVIQQ
jgi:hypothetical protein